MALEFITTDQFPARTFGARSTEPRVSVQANGQIQFNSVIAAELNGQTHALPGWDDEGRKLVFICRDKGTSKIPLEKMIELRRGKDGGSNPYFGGASLCNMKGYDYKSSGSQSFPAEVTKTKNGVEVSFTLPKGALPAKPTVPRKKKQAPAEVAPAGAKEAAAPATAPVAGTADDLDL